MRLADGSVGAVADVEFLMPVTLWEVILPMVPLG